MMQFIITITIMITNNKAGISTHIKYDDDYETVYISTPTAYSNKIWTYHIYEYIVYIYII